MHRVAALAELLAMLQSKRRLQMKRAQELHVVDHRGDRGRQERSDGVVAGDADANANQQTFGSALAERSAQLLESFRVEALHGLEQHQGVRFLKHVLAQGAFPRRFDLSGRFDDVSGSLQLGAKRRQSGPCQRDELACAGMRAQPSRQVRERSLPNGIGGALPVSRGAVALEALEDSRVTHADPWCRLLLVLLVVGTALFAVGCAPPTPPTPEQPIAYNHKVHIEAGLECVRCHRGADRVAQAGLPAVATCAACHRRVVPENPEVQKVLAAWEEKEPIRWRKVNVLPDRSMVHFHHGAHARAGVECATCHGDIASMTVAQPLREVADMGWCIDCHRENEASDDCLACHY